MREKKKERLLGDGNHVQRQVFDWTCFHVGECLILFDHSHVMKARHSEPRQVPDIQGHTLYLQVYSDFEVPVSSETEYVCPWLSKKKNDVGHCQDDY